jgi:hypothetical protein
MAATAKAPQTVDIVTAESPAAKPAMKKHAMTATWHLDDPSTWNFYQRTIMRLDILQQKKDTPAPPVHPKTDKVPYYPVWRQWAWIIPRALISVGLHRLFMEVTGWTFHPAFAFLYYTIAYKAFALACVRVFNKMGQKYGYFDGSHPRDGVPDEYLGKVVWSMLGTISIRPLFAAFLFYNREEKPSLSLWFPLQMFVYSVVLE